MLAVIRQLPNHESILAIVRVDILHARKRCVCDVGMISPEQITVVVNDVDVVIEPPEFQLFLAVSRGPVAEKSFLHFASGFRCNWDFVLASGEYQDAEANGNTEA
jgi:hypothetical protein